MELELALLVSEVYFTILLGADCIYRITRGIRKKVCQHQ